jgi:hypothetical protein
MPKPEGFRGSLPDKTLKMAAGFVLNSFVVVPDFIQSELTGR